MKLYLGALILAASLTAADDSPNYWEDTHWNQTNWKDNVYDRPASLNTDINSESSDSSSHNFNIDNPEKGPNFGE